MTINDVIIKPLLIRQDHRGWLCELFRNDELIEHHWPVMAYSSLTQPDTVRGPHEHKYQSDYFCFIGPSDFQLYLWDNRPDSSTYKTHVTLIVGESNPTSVIVPPGVVHGYRNVGSSAGLVFNAANQLYKGVDKQQEVDEIRHESDSNSQFVCHRILH